MRAPFENLEKLEYSPFIPEDEQDSRLRQELPALVGHQIPPGFLDFIRMFPNTGMFDAGTVVVEGIERFTGNDDGTYLVNMLFASCADERYDLLEIARRPPYECSPPRYLLQIGDDGGGNSFCLDLRPETFGRVLYWDQEVCSEKSGMHLVSRDFASFVEALRLVP